MIVFISCKDNVSEPNSVQKSYLIPFSPSNRWIYNVTIYDSVGTIKRTSTDTTIFYDTVISNVHWFHTYRNDWTYSNSDIGVVSRLIGDDHIVLTYKYPALKGEHYGSPSIEHANVGNEWLADTVYNTEIITTDTIITVPSGNYHCLGYKTLNNDATIISYTLEFISPGYGWIKSETYFSYNQGKNVYLFGKIEGKSIIIN